MELQIDIRHVVSVEDGTYWQVILAMPGFDKPHEDRFTFTHGHPDAFYATSMDALEAAETFIEGAKAVFRLSSRGGYWGHEGGIRRRLFARDWDKAEAAAAEAIDGSVTHD